MTVYVDDAYVPATVGARTSRWCHLFTDADDPAELHAFAARIGLRRAWFQPGRRPGDGRREPTRDHYDLAEEARAAAVATGAVEIGARDGARLRLARRRAAVGVPGEDVAVPGVPAPVMVGTLVRLRRRHRDDVARMHPLVTDALPHLRPWMPWATTYDRVAAAANAVRADEGWHAATAFAYVIEVGGMLVGACELWRQAPGTAELGYWLHPDHTGRGLATDAARLLVDAAFALPGISAVEVWHDAANLASAGVPRRLGFTEVGRRTPPRDPLTPGEAGIDVVWRLTRSFATARLDEVVPVEAPDGSTARPLCRIAGAGSMAHFQLAPGAVSWAVVHATVQEIWYVTGGAGEMWRAQAGREDRTPLCPGVCVTVPVGCAFQFRAETGAQPLEVVAITMPPWPDGSAVEARPVPGRWPASAATAPRGSVAAAAGSQTAIKAEGR